MARNLTADDARQSLTAHVENKGLEIFHQHGGRLDWAGLQRLLEDRTQVRYPCEIVFDAGPLQEGEFAHPVPKGDTPEDGFAMHVHPIYMLDLEQVPALVLYQLVALNYGEFASADDAEGFGAAALGMTRDEYYDLICDLAGQVGYEPETLEAVGEGGGAGSCGGGCTCGG